MSFRLGAAKTSYSCPSAQRLAGWHVCCCWPEQQIERHISCRPTCFACGMQDDAGPAAPQPRRVSCIKGTSRPGYMLRCGELGGECSCGLPLYGNRPDQCLYLAKQHARWPLAPAEVQEERRLLLEAVERLRTRKRLWARKKAARKRAAAAAQAAVQSGGPVGTLAQQL